MGLTKCAPDLKGGSGRKSSHPTKRLCRWRRRQGPRGRHDRTERRCRLYVMGMASSIKEGLSMAQEALQSGACLARLDAWAEASQKLAAAN